MRRPSIVPITLLAVLVFGACGGGSKSGSGTTTSIAKLSSPSWETAKPYPSKSAKMICQKEVRSEIASALGVTETRVDPAWSKSQHLYSCTYGYPTGKIVLTVKELSNERETTAYYDSIKNKYRPKNPIPGLGQGAWLLKSEDVVARKDYKVLLVDVHGIRANFVHGLYRSGVATSVATVILACWTGA